MIKNFARGLMLCLVFPGLPALAQEGHPLTGTWLGEWGEEGRGNFLTLILNWDGQGIGGLVNPGPDEGEINAITLDSSAWTVNLDMDIEDASGERVQWVAEGELENIGAYARTIKGTWRHAGGSGEFTLVRQGR